jgi:dipeptidyl aminopeptidase/acylaminoacyl peptidase
MVFSVTTANISCVTSPFLCCTERYMGTPQNNPSGYTASSVMTHVPTMTGKLMLVHGLIDENVHFRHTARLINTLISARKRYELMLFPCERHSPHKLQDKIYIEDIMQDFLVQNLHPRQPEFLSNASAHVSAVAAVAAVGAMAAAAPKIMSAL